MQHKRLYFIPGRGEGLDDGLGRLMATMGYTIHGREIISDFARLRISEQVALIGSDLQAAFWHSDAVLVGRSYGAYLLLHTLADMDPFLGKVLLCSPVLGSAVAQDGFYVSRPPRAEKLVKLAESSGFSAPRSMEIYTGAEDNGCDPLVAVRFASLVGKYKAPHSAPCWASAQRRIPSRRAEQVLGRYFTSCSRTRGPLTIVQCGWVASALGEIGKDGDRPAWEKLLERLRCHQTKG